MTVRPAIEPPHDAAAEAVVRAVGAARRRLRLVVALRQSSIAVPAGIAAGAALSLAGWAPLWTSMALAGLAAAAAAAWAVARTPPVDSVARTLDTRLGLRDRVAAALQLQQTGGPIATLVARDAAARLAPVDVASLFPVALGRSPAVALTVAVALVAWDLSIGTGGGRAPVALPTVNTESADAAEAARRAPEGAPPPPAGTNRPDSQPRLREAGSQERNDQPRAGDTPGAASPVPGPAQLATPPTPDGSTGRSTNASTQNQQTTSAQAAASGGGREGQGGSSAGLTPTGPSRTGAGGTAAGNQVIRAGDDRTPPTSAASYRAARASAEAALGRDVIPPDYRDHVRAYFNSIGGAR